jgi:hypothetical protein
LSVILRGIIEYKQINIYTSSKSLYISMHYYMLPGVAITEAVSRWLPTAAARVRARVWQVGFVVDKVASGRFSPSTSASPAKTVQSTNFSIFTITRGS